MMFGFRPRLQGGDSGDGGSDGGGYGGSYGGGGAGPSGAGNAAAASGADMGGGVGGGLGDLGGQIAPGMTADTKDKNSGLSAAISGAKAGLALGGLPGAIVGGVAGYGLGGGFSDDSSGGANSSVGGSSGASNSSGASGYGGGNGGGVGGDIYSATGGVTQNTTGGTGMASSSSAANKQASYEQQALDYLMQNEAIPQQFREGSLQALGGLYGLEGGTGSQQDIIDRAQASPLYSAIMGGRQAGEEAILRNASATGGLRSGNVQGALTDYGSQLDNRALLESYNQQISGLTGLAQLPSNANQIAATQAGIGNTLAMGDIASQQADQAKMGQYLAAGTALLGNEGVQDTIGDAFDWVSDWF